MQVIASEISQPRRRRQHAGRRGFTITEILVVIIIIVLMLAMAMPVFRFITGSRSQAGATNQIAAFLGRCRNDAVGLQQTMGCGFYVDSTTGRTAMVEIQQVQPNVTPWDSSFNTPYPLATYVSQTPAGSTKTSYYVAVKAVPAAPNGSGLTSIDISNLAYWQPVTTANSTSDNYTDTSAPGAGLNQNAGGNTAAGSFISNLYDRVPGTDAELLPAGVGVQLAIDDNRAVGGNTAAGSAPTSDRYVRVGAVLFDASGRLTSSNFIFCRNGAIGSAAGFSSYTGAINIANNYGSQYIAGTAGTAAALDSPLYSSYGLVLYDRDAWLSQNFPGGDFITGGPGAPTKYNAPTPSELNDEAWLDTNGTPLLVNRYTGTMLRSE